MFTYLLNKINCPLQVHAEVNEGPLYTFLLVLLLLQHKHVVVEELLQTLVGVVDAKLLKGVVLEKNTINFFKGVVLGENTLKDDKERTEMTHCSKSQS